MFTPTSVLSFSSFVLKCIFGLKGNVAAVWHEEEEDSKGMKRKTNEDKIMSILLYMTSRRSVMASRQFLKHKSQMLVHVKHVVTLRSSVMSWL